MSDKKTVYVIYYSLYGHVQTLARAECKGLERAGGNNIEPLKFYNFCFQ